jgi:hypothetical protein
LDDARYLWNQADCPVSLVSEGVHLPDNLGATFVDEGLLLPQRRDDDLFIAGADEVTSVGPPPRLRIVLLRCLR